MSKDRYTATIVRHRDGTVKVRLSDRGVNAEGDVDVIEALNQRDDETPQQLYARANKYIHDNGIS